MKIIFINIFLGFLLFLILFPIDKDDIPRYSYAEVKAVAHIYSPECLLKECG